MLSILLGLPCAGLAADGVRDPAAVATRTAAFDAAFARIIGPESLDLPSDRYDADLERSVDIDLGRWRRRAWVQRVKEASVTPFRRFL